MLTETDQIIVRLSSHIAVVESRLVQLDQELTTKNEKIRELEASLSKPKEELPKKG